MKKFILSGVLTLFIVGVAFVPNAKAEELSIAEQLQALLAQVEELNKKIAEIRGEIKVVLKDGLAEGMTDEDVAKIQEILATDPSLYPEGLVTGYFGPLTRKALMRFQERHQIRVTGELDEETREWFEGYLDQAYGGKIPPGLLKAPGILKKVEYRFRFGDCDKSSKRGMGPLCKKLKMKYHDSDDEDGDDEDDDFDEIEVEIEFDDGETELSFKFEGVEYENIQVDSTNLGDILEAIADALDVEVDELDEDLTDAVEDEYDEEMEDVLGDFEIEVEIEDGETTLSFTFEDEDYEVVVESTDLSDVLDAAANEIDSGDDAEDLDEDLSDAIEIAFNEELADYEEDMEDAEEDAENAIVSATEAIAAAQEDIDVASDGNDKDNALMLLGEAQGLLDDAQDAFDLKDYEDAEDLAVEAEVKANDAEDEI